MHRLRAVSLFLKNPWGGTRKKLTCECDCARASRRSHFTLTITLAHAYLFWVFLNKRGTARILYSVPWLLALCYFSLFICFQGTAGDSLTYHRCSAFTTKDRDNDKNSANCATLFKGAWWYNSCTYSDLNGVYYHGQHSHPWSGVQWYHWKGHSYSAKRAEMKIKPVKN